MNSSTPLTNVIHNKLEIVGVIYEAVKIVIYILLVLRSETDLFQFFFFEANYFYF